MRNTIFFVGSAWRRFKNSKAWGILSADLYNTPSQSKMKVLYLSNSPVRSLLVEIRGASIYFVFSCLSIDLIGSTAGVWGLSARAQGAAIFVLLHLKGVAILNSYFLVGCLINGNIFLTDFKSFCSIVRSSFFNSFWD